ncbi:hypothetical protein PACTADRAFT_49669 [Pachysolen tannophilus NRRL Y-2460]|uniref:IMS import disulfide relay-system CHCH-CHCH-like Cx9C domain-containing protein n=1 Tax=Pachysolen tannophilus NRRL Y-2460 TaxID=669874 RepID=A0A1E4TX50_PACTA|nr:hypothetical protein PACTADRAFT_49669 [Pachysolen tannophilus NRRL Y-2460]
MSAVLDQILLDDIAKYCPQQFLNYHKCMTSPTPESNFCLNEQQSLSTCIKTGVPSFQKIQETCATHMKDLENCYRTNQGKDKSVCQEKLINMRKCASGVVNDGNHKSGLNDLDLTVKK